MREKLKRLVSFLLNPHFIICFGIAWLITNGWAYIMLFVGGRLCIEWMTAVAGAYVSFLWFPGTPEKLVTVAIALFLQKTLFPSDKKTLSELQSLKANVDGEGKDQNAGQNETTNRNRAA